MKSILPLVLLLTACGASVATAAPMQFAAKRAGISHSLTVKNLEMDAKGVPSFDYTYTQQSTGCNFVITGKAVAGHEEANGKVELEVHNPQGADGKQAAAILNFYDGEANFILPYKEVLRPKSVTYFKVLDDATRARSCDKKADRIEVSLKKTAR